MKCKTLAKFTNKKIFFLSIVVGMLFLFNDALAFYVNLNDFYADPSVIIATDGMSANMTEDPNYFSVLLSNDPSAGDPGIFIPLTAHNLTFNYNFTEPIGNDNYFYVWLINPNTGTVLQDVQGNKLEFELDNTNSGTVIWNLIDAAFLGTTIGLEFQLNANIEDTALTSEVRINNVQINAVPAPSTFFLLGSGLWILLNPKRKIYKH